MRFAVIGDIHSNKFALKSALEDIKKRDVDFIISTGDLVGYLPFPNEVIELMRKNKVLVVKGNHDYYIGNLEPVKDKDIKEMTDDEIQKNASSVFTNWIITENNKNYLKNLPDKISMSCGEMKVIVVHGSPRAIDEYLYEDTSHLSKLADTISEEVVIFGHTHIPYYKKINNKHFINAGSIGKPKHGSSKSTYMLVDIEDNKVNCEIVEVGYNVEAIIEEIEGNPMISNKLISMLQQGI